MASLTPGRSKTNTALDAEKGNPMEKDITVTMPRLRPGMETGVLCAWLKEEGDVVCAGEPLFEIETDKVVNQIESVRSGVLKKQLCEEGDTLAVDAPVAVIETE